MSIKTERLDALADKLVTDVSNRLEGGDVVLNKNGEVERISAPPAVLNAAVSLLKAANYQFIATGGEEGEGKSEQQLRLEAIQKQMQEAGDDTVVAMRKHL